VVLAYDFSRETRRYAHLRQTHPNLRWVEDAVTPAKIREILEGIVADDNHLE
jgi:hypothetical protein